MRLLFLFGFIFILSVYSTFSCPENCNSGSCCEKGLNNLKCCPYVNGVCCANSDTCCPQGSKCIDFSRKCEYINGYLGDIVNLINPEELPRALPEPMMDPIDVTQHAQIAKAAKEELFVMCQDRRSACPSNFTCCKQGDAWGCCGHPEAVCCSDGKHCCPANTRCNSGTCEPINTSRHHTLNGELHVLQSKLRSTYVDSELALSGHKVTCDDKKSNCPSGTTCCLDWDKKWACCPMPEAVCCPDGKHCCPNGFKCDLKYQNCIRTATKLEVKAAMTPQGVIPPFVNCSRSVVCPHGNTCCPSRHGYPYWSCCPFNNSVCCSDGLHCCPNGTICDIRRHMCIFRSNSSVSALKTAKVPSNSEVTDSKICSGGLFHCPTGNTCCQNGFGTQSCCPFTEAVCCGDGLHCCPKGSRCDNNLGVCISRKSIPWFTKIPAKQEYVPPVDNTASSDLKRCSPGSPSYCSTGGTCCPLGNGSYSCCSEPNAVCCSDHRHCCPAGTQCNSGECRKLSVDNIHHHTLSSATEKNSTDVLCSDRKSRCTESSTCCALNNNEMSCCSMPNAVCCSDGVHCCPENTVCDIERGECIRKLKHHPAVRKPFKMHPIDKRFSTYTGHLPVNSASLGEVQHSTFCGNACGHDSWSCCPDAEGNPQSMCCPLNGGVCCPGGQFCCPVGTKCSADYTRCEHVVDPILRTAALYLISNLGQSDERLAHHTHEIFPFEMAKADVFLYYLEYRRLKESRRTVCRNGLWYCPSNRKCCSLGISKFLCVPFDVPCP